MGAVGAAARRRDLGESLQRVRPGLRAPLLVRSGGREVPAWLHDQEQGEHPRTTSGQLRPAFVWVHVGGYVGGDPAQEHGLCTLIACRTGGLALSVEYRLRAAAPPSGGAGRLPHRPHLAARARRRARSRPRPRRGRGARPARRTSRVSRTGGSGAATSTSSSTRTSPTRTACARRGHGSPCASSRGCTTAPTTARGRPGCAPSGSPESTRWRLPSEPVGQALTAPRRSPGPGRRGVRRDARGP